MSALRLMLFGTAASLVLAQGASAQFALPLAECTFDADAEGWSIVTTLPTKKQAVARFKSLGGNIGGTGAGHLSQTDPGKGISYWRASAAFVGAKSAALGGTLSFDLVQTSRDSQVNSPDVILVAGDGTTLVYKLARHPGTRWTRYHVLLDEGAGWRLGTMTGPLASRAKIAEVLEDLADMRVRAEYRSGSDTDGLDNVVLAPPAAGTPFSRFDTGNEGWFVVNDANTPVWSAPAEGQGSPGGCIRVTDRGDGPYFSFQAPAKFLGDRTGAYAQPLSFDIKTNLHEGRPLGIPDVMLAGGGLTLVYDAPANPANSWTHFEVNLSEKAGWRIGTLKGLAPTREQFLSVLAAVTDLQIRGEFSTRLDTGFLDNVSFGTPCLADYDANGVVNPDDLSDFITVYFFPGAYGDGRTADYSGDGIVNPDDLADYIRVYFNGCD